MTIFDLLFIMMVIITVVALLSAGYALVRGRWRAAGGILLRVGVLLGLYAVYRWIVG